MKNKMELRMSADVFYQEGKTDMLYNISRSKGIGFCRASQGGFGDAS